MKKGILLFGFLFLLLVISSVSAGLCKNSNGYYDDCYGYNNYGGYNHNYYGKNNYDGVIYLDYDGYRVDYNYDKNYVRNSYNKKYKESIIYGGSRYEGYDERVYRVDYKDRYSIGYKKGYNDGYYESKSDYFHRPRSYPEYYVQKWTYRKRDYCPSGWICLKGDRVY